MIYVIIVAALAVLLGLAGFIGFNMAFRRGPGSDLIQQMEKPGSTYYSFRETIRAGYDWVQTSQFEDVYITSRDGLRLHGRFLPGRSDRCLLMIHGYRSSGEKDFSCACRFYHEELGMSLLIATQRASDKSEGTYITFGVQERYDALLWAEYIRDRMGNDIDLFLTGVSMGASTVLMASDLPLPDCVRGIIADCGFTSPEDIILKVMRKNMHLPKYPLFPIVKLYARLAGFPLSSADARRSVANTSIPLQLIHGRRDGFVPCYMTEENFAAATGEKYVFYSETADHGCSYLVDREPLEAAITKFVTEHLKISR